MYDQIEALNLARAQADAAFLETTSGGRDHYRLTIEAAYQAELRWLADPTNELSEQAAADAHAELVEERRALVKSIAGAKGARTRRITDAWDQLRSDDGGL